MVRSIDQIDLKDKRVFLRVDYNVKFKDGQIKDDSRILASLLTVEYILKQKAKLIIASHLGRPKGRVDPSMSLVPVGERLSQLLKTDVYVPEDCVGDAVKKIITDLRDGQIVLLENLRFHSEEESNDPVFSEKLANLADVYINDAFGAVHRAHASTVGMVGYFKEKGIGLLMKQELEALAPLIHRPQKPFLTILGGAKVSDKIGVIEHLMSHVDAFLVGGGMAYTFLKAKGYDVGKSLVEDGKLHMAERILKRAEIKGVKFLLPVDSVVAEKIEDNIPCEILKNGVDWKHKMGLDIGPETIRNYEAEIAKAATVFWNGPMGVFETPPFEKGTFALAKAIAFSGAKSVVGGGDSLAAIKQTGLENQFGHLSTGGGASMEFLEGRVLPGLKALES